jgi:hypothetical protein
LPEAGGEQVDHFGGEEHAEQAEGADDEHDGRGDEVGEVGGFGAGFFLQRFDKSGDEG